MELKNFVAQTLLAISNGIIEAQLQSGSNGLIIAPHLADSGYIQNNIDGIKKPHNVHFNLKVAVEAKGEAGKKGGDFSIQVFNIAAISIGNGDIKNSSLSSTTLQEISFDIPVLWPTNSKQNDASPLPPKEYDPFKS